MRAHPLNSKGVSLVELMAGVGISTILMLVTMGVMFSLYPSVANLQSRFGRDTLRSALLVAQSHETTCAGVFNTTVFDPNKAATSTGLPMNVILDSGATVIKSQDPAASPTPQPLPNYNLFYEYVSMKNTVFLRPDPAIAGNNLYQGALVMKVDQQSTTDSSKVGLMMPEQTIGGIVVSVTPSNSISSCGTVQTVEDVCTAFGGTPNPTPPPTCMMTYPCPVNQIFAGNDASGRRICLPSVTSCPAGMGITTDSTGATICKTP